MLPLRRRHVQQRSGCWQLFSGSDWQLCCSDWVDHLFGLSYWEIPGPGGSVKLQAMRGWVLHRCERLLSDAGMRAFQGMLLQPGRKAQALPALWHQLN